MYYYYLSCFQPLPTELSVESNPYKIAIINSTLYWTQLREVNENSVRIDRPGAIYTMSNSSVTQLIQSPDLSPHDLCFFYDHFEGQDIKLLSFLLLLLLLLFWLLSRVENALKNKGAHAGFRDDNHQPSRGCGGMFHHQSASKTL